MKQFSIIFSMALLGTLGILGLSYVIYHLFKMVGLMEGVAIWLFVFIFTALYLNRAKWYREK